MLNLEEPHDLQAQCPPPREGRRNKKKKKRSRKQNTAIDELHPDAVPQIPTRRKRAPQCVDPKNGTTTEVRQNASNTSPNSRQEEMRLYMDKLRELIPHLPKQGKMAQSDLIQKTIEHIRDLQHTLENHPRLQGLDPRVIAAPGNSIPPMQMQQLLLQQQRQQRLIQMEQQQRWQHFQPQDQFQPIEPYHIQEHDQHLEQFQRIDGLGEFDRLEANEYRQPYAPSYQQQHIARNYGQFPHLQPQQQQQMAQQQQAQLRRPLSTIASTLQSRRDSKLSVLSASLRLHRTSGD